MISSPRSPTHTGTQGLFTASPAPGGDLLSPLDTYTDGELTTSPRAGPFCCWVGRREDLLHFVCPHPLLCPSTNQPAAGGFLRWPYPLGEVGCCPPPPGVPSPSASHLRPRLSQVPGAPDQVFALPTVLTAPHPLLQQRVHPQPRLRQRQREQGGHGAGRLRDCWCRERIRVFLGTPLCHPRGVPLSSGLEARARAGQERGAFLCPLSPVAAPSDLASPHCSCPGRVQPLLGFSPHPGVHRGQQPQACPPSSCAALHGASGGSCPRPRSALWAACPLPSCWPLLLPGAPLALAVGLHVLTLWLRGYTFFGPHPGVLWFPQGRARSPGWGGQEGLACN